MLRIGLFSKFSRVSIKTLRYYDEIGLLRPVAVDDRTGYRLYAVSQLSRLNRILALKDLGFSLEQISQMLDEGLSLEEMQGMLRMRKAELQQQMKETRQRLERVEARLRQIEKEVLVMEQEVVIKKVEPMQVASICDVVKHYGAQGKLWDEMGRYFRQHAVKANGPSLVLDHSGEYRKENVNLEVATPFSGSLPQSDRVKVKLLEGIETAACILHREGYETLPDTYDVLLKWIDENGYIITGPDREIYWQCPGSRDQDPLEFDQNLSPYEPKGYVTEVQFPVRKG